MKNLFAKLRAVSERLRSRRSNEHRVVRPNERRRLLALASVAPFASVLAASQARSAGSVPAALPPNFLVVLPAGGAADSSGLINGAINTLAAAGGGTVYLVAALYYANILMKPGVNLVGVPAQGEASTWGSYPLTPSTNTGTVIFPTSAASPVVSFQGSTGSGTTGFQFNCTLANVKLANSSLASGSIGLYAYLADFYKVEHVIIENFDTGILLDLTWGMDFCYLMVGANNNNVILASDTGNSSSTPIRFWGCVISSAYISNFVINGNVEVLNVIGGECSGCGTATNNPQTAGPAIKITGTTTFDILFSGVRFESNGSYDVSIDSAGTSAPGGPVWFQNCTFRRFSLIAGSSAILMNQSSGLAVKECFFSYYSQVFTFSGSSGTIDIDGCSYANCTTAGNAYTLGNATISIPMAPFRIVGNNNQGITILGGVGSSAFVGSANVQGTSSNAPQITMQEYNSPYYKSVLAAGVGAPSLTSAPGGLYGQQDVSIAGNALWAKTNGTSTTGWAQIQIRQSGATGSRPTLNSTTDVGFEWFDTTLGYPVWWTGSAWHNAVGAVA